jgi:hypothetical protein
MKEVIAECHVFGTDGGYCTLARTSGLASHDVRELERFDFSVDHLNADAEKAFAESGSAYLLPLKSGRFAIRRVLPDVETDNYGRAAMITATIILTEEDYVSVASVDGGPSGTGLEGIVRDLDMWRRLCDCRRGGIDQLRLPILGDGGVRRIVREDFQIFDAWQVLLKSGEGDGASVPRGSAYESRLLALPALLSRKSILKYHWGVGVMRQSVPRMVASYLDPSLIPAAVRPVQLAEGAEYRSVLTKTAERLMQHFPDAPWHSHREWQDLERRLRDTEEGVQAQKGRGDLLAKQLEELKGDKEAQYRRLSDECLKRDRKNEALELNLRTASQQARMYKYVLVALALTAALVILGLIGQMVWSSAHGLKGRNPAASPIDAGHSNVAPATQPATQVRQH